MRKLLRVKRIKKRKEFLVLVNQVIQKTANMRNLQVWVVKLI